MLGGKRELREKIVSGGRERSYRVFVPEGFGRNGPGPALQKETLQTDPNYYRYPFNRP